MISLYVSNEIDWTQETFVRDEKDNELAYPNDPSGKKFCLNGAVLKACFIFYPDKEYPYDLIKNTLKIIRNKIKEKGVSFIVYWNDTPGRTKREVIELLKEIEGELE